MKQPPQGDWQALATKELHQAKRTAKPSATVDGIDLKMVYTAGDLEGEVASLPGLPPYTRGVRATMYAGKPWTIRQYAGFSTAEETNAFYQQCLKDGQTALSVAFDLATHRGYDSDHPRVRGDVGKAGVAIDTVEDMKRLFANIPLEQLSVSMTMNGAVIPVMAFYIVAAQEQGISQDQLSGTIQNDILKEFLVRNTYIYPPQASMRLVGDIIAYCSQHLPKFNPISISGYHMHEAGASPAQELAYTIADGLEYVRQALGRGLDVDQFAPRLSFFFGIGMNFFTEIAKLRAARTLWFEVMQQFQPKHPQSSMLRTHCQTSGVSLAVQDPYNNIIRTTIEALAAVLGGTQSLHTNSFDEALSLPTLESSRVARHTQLILAEECALTNVADPLGGSYYVEYLTAELIAKAKELIAEVEGFGGMTNAIELGIPKRRIEAAAAQRQVNLENGVETIVGVNKYERQDQPDVSILDINAAMVREQQVARLNDIKQKRDQQKCQAALHALAAAIEEGNNLLEAAIVAARARATLGEISSVMEGAFGRYQTQATAVQGVWQENMKQQPHYQEILKNVKDFAKDQGRQPRILLAKLGQDGHDRGIKVVASAFADCGFDVDLGPLFATPQEAARHAVENDVHVIGVSTLAAGHKTLLPELVAALAEYGADDIKVICGGIIPPQDQKFLFDAGVSLIFTPGQKVLEIVEKTLNLIR